MHIEPGIVNDAKIILSYATAAGAFTFLGRSAIAAYRSGTSTLAMALRSTIATGLVFSFFQVLPHTPVGVSEVHLILGSTLFLILGAVPAAIGLALGLALQGLTFAQFDLPQYGMNVTTLLVPLFAMAHIAGRIIPEKTAYKDITYKQALALSTAFQAGIVSWVAFWAFYGQGFGAANLAHVASFSLAYLSVIAIEPLVDLAVLSIAKSWGKTKDGLAIAPRLFSPAN